MTAPRAEVIGDPVAHSKSPLIHRFWLERLGLAGEYRATRVDPGALSMHLQECRHDASWRGCNVTIPHKQAVLDLLDRVDPAAARIGAVNCVVREGDRLVGYNSDGVGFLEPLRPLLASEYGRRTARVLGAGGAARAIVHALADAGFMIEIAARSRAQAEALIAELPGDHRATTLDELAGVADPAGLNLLVNSTPLGMTGQPPLAVDLSRVPPGTIVYDIVYAPLETALLRDACRAGLRAIDGLHMLIGQAAMAFELFFGQAPPRDEDARLRQVLTS